jgi:SAM-dependent methyltransferase
MNSDVIDANRRVHSNLILSGEYQRSPHKTRQNVIRVNSELSKFNLKKPGITHLDIGCGDGFIFECRPLNWISHGIDATPEMLKICTNNYQDVVLKEGIAELLPYEDESFDVVTCYSFLDHLESTERFYFEAMRVLKPGGNFYFGLSPNRSFYNELMQSKDFELSEILNSKIDLVLELQKAFDDGTYYEENFGINKYDLIKCEPGKSIKKGLSPKEECSKLKKIGASKIKIKYDWVFQQNKIDTKTIKTLIDFLPFTSPCFKYFDIIGSK